MINLFDLRHLLELSHAPMLSLYLAVDPALPENQAAVPAWRRWLKTALREMENELEEQHSAAWFEIHKALEGVLESYAPNAKTLVLFCGKDFLQSFELAVAINNYISFGEPALTALLQLIHQHKSYLLVFSDHETARIWLVALNSIEYEEERRLEWYCEDWREMTLMPAT